METSYAARLSSEAGPQSGRKAGGEVKPNVGGAGREARGARRGDDIRTRASSVGVPTKEPMDPAVDPIRSFCGKEMGTPCARRGAAGEQLRPRNAFVLRRGPGCGCAGSVRGLSAAEGAHRWLAALRHVEEISVDADAARAVRPLAEEGRVNAWVQPPEQSLALVDLHSRVQWARIGT